MKFILVYILFLTACNNEILIGEKKVRSIYWTQVNASKPFKKHSFLGIVYPNKYSDLSFQISGKLKTLTAIEGQYVTKGDVIAILDNEHLQLKLLESNSNLDSVKVKYIQVKSEHNRLSNLYIQKLASQAEIDKMNLLFNIAKNDLETGQHKQKLCEKDLQNSIVLAPFSGVISKRYVQNNQVVHAGTKIVKIDGDNNLQVKFDLPEQLRLNIKIGNILSILSNSKNATQIPAKVVEISSPNINESTFNVTLALTEKPKTLLAGMTVQVKFKSPIITTTETVFKIPVTAIDSDMSGKHNIFVFNSDTSRVHKLPIVILGSSQNSVLVSGKLNDDSIIASAGVNLLQENQVVALYKNYNK